MKELSIEEKAKAYDEALERAKEWYDNPNSSSIGKGYIYAIFPELKESKGEMIRQLLMRFVKYDMPDNYSDDFSKEDCLAWLEKQGENKPLYKIKMDKEYKCIASPRYSTFMTGEIYKPEDKFLCSLMNFCSDCFEPIEDGEQKPANKVEPKFKVGDFIVNDYCMGKVIELTSDAYLLDTGQGIPFSCEHNAHLWTIQDAKDGDVLKEDSCIFIIKKINPNGTAIVHCCLFDDGELDLTSSTLGFDVDSTYPAIKEQRDLLFAKMKEAGYEWDAEKKELKKISQRMISAEAKEAMYAKPAWSEEDEYKLNMCITAIETSYKWDSMVDWLKSLKQRMGG